MNPKINIIVAISNNNVIGKNNTIPWYYPEDLKYFKKCTTYHPLGHKNIMIMANFSLVRAALNVTVNGNILVPNNSLPSLNISDPNLYNG